MINATFRFRRSNEEYWSVFNDKPLAYATMEAVENALKLHQRNNVAFEWSVCTERPAEYAIYYRPSHNGHVLKWERFYSQKTYSYLQDAYEQMRRVAVNNSGFTFTVHNVHDM